MSTRVSNHRTILKTNTDAFVDCGESTAPTDPVPNPIHMNGTDPVCASDTIYTTKSGDTCDSIALAHYVSSASLYYNNPYLLDCANTGANLNLCLPLQCQTYTVKSTDKCVAIAAAHNASWGDIVRWNDGIDSQCYNIYGAEPSFGTTICVSPPGGKLDLTNPSDNSAAPGNSNTGGQGGSGDGYSDTIVSPPQGTVADGTTKRCGGYIQAKSGVGCSSMIAQNAVTMDLFLAVNPSLKSVSACNSNLKDVVWYCLHPFRFWNSTSTAMVTSMPSTISATRTWVTESHPETSAATTAPA